MVMLPCMVLQEIRGKLDLWRRAILVIQYRLSHNTTVAKNVLNSPQYYELRHKVLIQNIDFIFLFLL